MKNIFSLFPFLHTVSDNHRKKLKSTSFLFWTIALFRDNFDDNVQCRSCIALWTILFFTCSADDIFNCSILNTKLNNEKFLWRIYHLINFVENMWKQYGNWGGAVSMYTEPGLYIFSRDKICSQERKNLSWSNSKVLNIKVLHTGYIWIYVTHKASFLLICSLYSTEGT